MTIKTIRISLLQTSLSMPFVLLQTMIDANLEETKGYSMPN